jgi:hypothetical protein
MAADKAVPEAVPEAAIQPEMAKAAAPEVYVLTKNFGPVVAGKSYWWPKGSEFTMPKDAEMVGLMFRFGASLQLKA